MKAHGSWTTNGYYATKLCIMLGLCEGVEL
jgi:hypothetical protein